MKIKKGKDKKSHLPMKTLGMFLHFKCFKFAFLVGVFLFCYWQNNALEVTNFEYTNTKIPKAFDGFTIVQISDLHNKMFGHHQQRLIKKLAETKPDIIVITGDLIDRRRYNLDNALLFVSQAIRIAPVYYVSGNHEIWSGKYDEVKQALVRLGVTVLDNQLVAITKGDAQIDLCGLKDPSFLTEHRDQLLDYTQVQSPLSQWATRDSFKILLAHRPELFQQYTQNGMDVIFSGHAHGGQIRLPGIGGVFAPDQGFFPKYTAGRYDNGSTTMFLSRGLGNSLFPLRLFDFPQIVAVTLKH